ncbi:MAG TPA: aminodeoxychorismate/anthranilate synthase component II [Candidatus Marinimicrobia bacterium]|nr:aminodeoxychorismate/anthranilate synthase component II [Candidatus Neomarinimicrobiota bacterium]
MILFIDNYDSFTYNLVDYIGQMEPDLRVIRNDQIAVSDIARLHPQGIVISPGPGTPANAGISCALIQTYYRTIPILGVCLGFQAIGQVFGARIVRAPVPVHGKTSAVSHNGQGLFYGIPSLMQVARYHSLMVEQASLPDAFVISAESDDGLIMGLQHKRFPLYGVQFHPESILTPDGMTLLRNWLKITRRYQPQQSGSVT